MADVSRLMFCSCCFATDVLWLLFRGWRFVADVSRFASIVLDVVCGCRFAAAVRRVMS